MDTEERIESYADRHASHGQAMQVHADWTANTWLTPAERRRIRHKQNSPRTHSHETLLTVPDREGNFHRQPCPKCTPPRQRKPHVGGTA